MTDRENADLGGLTCRELVQLVTAYLDHQLDADTTDRFERHLATCPGCSRYLDQIRASVDVLGRVSLDSISAESRDELLDAFREWKSGTTS